MNTVNIIGRLTKQADMRYTQSGTAVASFTLAVDRTFKNANGEKETDFVNCIAWKHTAEAIANYTDKGHRIGITGRIQVRNYENNEGKRIYVTEVVAEQVTFLEPKNAHTGDNSQNHTNTPPNQNKGNSGQYGQSSDSFSGGQSININDDDLPF